MDYTIIHPGGLKDTPGGLSDFDLDVDDLLLKREKRSITREDVADLCIASLGMKKGENVSLDCINKNGENETKVRSANQALRDFLVTGKSCNYSI